MSQSTVLAWSVAGCAAPLVTTAVAGGFDSGSKTEVRKPRARAVRRARSWYTGTVRMTRHVHSAF